MMMSEEQIVELAERVSELVTQGQFWWMRPDGSLYATTERDGGAEGDSYLLDASPEWIAQWGGDWQATAVALAPLYDQIEAS